MDGPAKTRAPVRPRRWMLFAGAVLLLGVLLGAGLFFRGRLAAGPADQASGPPCGVSALQIGKTRIPIAPVDFEPSHPLNIPPNVPGVVFWIGGTNVHYVFALSPTDENLALLQQVKPGEPLTISWGDCSYDLYVANSIEQSIPEQADLLDQSTGGIRVYVPQTASSAGLLIEGGRPGVSDAQAPEPVSPDTPAANISFLDQSTSEDGKTLKLAISVENVGSVPIHLEQSTISLGVEGEAPQAPLAVAPALPADIWPGDQAQFIIMFAQPAAKIAVFKILDFSVDLYF